MKNIRTYIDESWNILTRDMSRVLELVSERKYQGRPVLFISASEKKEKIAALLPPGIDLRILPKTTGKVLAMKEQGLLYLPRPYVVPGGRFNEMYGWDSFFIILGLLSSGRIQLAKDMVDNQIYQIRHYGKVLNANRTYYISRSHPPLISGAVLAVFEKTRDTDWLESCVEPLERYFAYFRKGRKYDPATRLSRYADESTQPAYELKNSNDEKSYYNAVKEAFKTGNVEMRHPLSTFYDRKKDKLTGTFFRSDRSMRESGFDITDMFGGFSCETVFTAPVCLNSLLFKMATDIEKIHGIIGNPRKQKTWMKKADGLKEAINTYLWDEKLHGYFGYDTDLEKRNDYLYATAFYPLWAGLASPDQAERTLKTASPLLAGHGLLTSPHVTGKQWDAPFGWAPLTYFAAEGMIRYGFMKEAVDLMQKFNRLIETDFNRTGTIKEKYDVVHGTSDADITYGYHSNEIGFGWTNAVYLIFGNRLGT